MSTNILHRSLMGRGQKEGVYLTMTVGAGTRVSFSSDVEYRYNKGAWTKLVTGSKTTAATSNTTLEFRARLTPTSDKGVGSFVISETNSSVRLSGNCMSLLFGDDAADVTSLVGYDYAFKSLFANVSVELLVYGCILPATTLSEHCYEYMFLNSNLSWFPEDGLPATNLAPHCYSGMFYGCANLAIKMPYLDATTLYKYCYSEMFSGCTSLWYGGNLPAYDLPDYCYFGMFEGCTSLEKIFSIGRGDFGKYSCAHMYYGCTKLTSAPGIVASSLDSDCCWNMFRNCTGLTSMGGLQCNYLADGCYSWMFAGCTNLTSAPDLTASTLVDSCYVGMFNGCSRLTSIKMLATDVSAYNCLRNWVVGVPSSGTFIKHPNASLPYGASGIPSGWTVQTATS